MATTKRMKIEGKPVRPYSLYRIGLNDEIIELVVRADKKSASGNSNAVGPLQQMTAAGRAITAAEPGAARLAANLHAKPAAS
jgi:hypothetical protein